jgi:hypothetical protein
MFRHWLHRRTHSKIAYSQVVFLVTVPKYKASDDKRDTTQANIREQIGVAETLYSSIGGVRAERGLMRWVFGRRDHVSLEMVAHRGLISFYVAAPLRVRDYIEQQILAQYPDAVLEEVVDYNMFHPKGATMGAELTFRESYVLPIKTYETAESDPLLALANALSKLNEDEGAAIQFVVRSSHKRWRKSAKRIVSELHKGKSREEAFTGGNIFTQVLKFFGDAALNPEKRSVDNPADKPEKHQMSAMEQEMAKGMEQKISKAGLDVTIRIIVSASTRQRAEVGISNIIDSFTQYNLYHYGNSFTAIRPRKQEQLINDFIYRHFNERSSIVVNTEELASLYHLPLSSTDIPNIHWLRARQSAPPDRLPQTGIILGESKFRGTSRIIRFAPEDRRRHAYIIGTTGSGKSTMMEEMVKQDIANGEGVCFVDPHGSAVESILESVPKERANDVVYFDPSDVNRPIGLNMLEAKNEAEMDFVTQEMIAIFYKLVSDPAMIGPMFEHNMRNAMFTLMSDREHPGTIAEIPRIFTDPQFQKYKVSKVTDPIVREFWEKEMAKTSDFHKSEMLGYLISKVGRFVENAMMRNIIGQSKSGFNVREIMDNKKILLVNLSKGKVGEINSNLLGLIIVSKLQMAALSRADNSSGDFPDFYLYIDEFQNFITDSIATILSEARKYKLNLTMAHQYMGQLVQNNDSSIRDAVLGNVGTMIAYRIGIEDAQVLAKQFEPVFGEYDMVNIDKYRAHVKLLIDNTVSRPFDIHAAPPTFGDPERARVLKQYSRTKYGRDRADVEKDILEQTRLGASIGGNSVSEPMR